MKKSQLEVLEQSFGIDLDEKKITLFDKYTDFFLSKNSVINLISKNDEKFLFEKHIFDSLAICKFFNSIENEQIEKKSLLDFGTGGGFPSVPVSILFDKLDVYAVDSIRKKINAVSEIKDHLELNNLHTICERVENINQTFDYVTTRAVASLDKILKYAVPKLKSRGYFIAYKSQKFTEELKDAEKTIKTSGMKMVNIIKYSLPLEENFERNLIIFQKKK